MAGNHKKLELIQLVTIVTTFIVVRVDKQNIRENTKEDIKTRHIPNIHITTQHVIIIDRCSTSVYITN